jgi:hypothetical protein
MEPYVFIVGCARSGTTLLERMLNAHPMMAIAPEIHWITNAFPCRPWNSSRCLVTTEMLDSLVKHKMFRRLNVSREDFIRPVSPGYPIKGAKFLIRCFGLYRLVRGKILVGSKTFLATRRGGTTLSMDANGCEGRASRPPRKARRLFCRHAGPGAVVRSSSAGDSPGR